MKMTHAVHVFYTIHSKVLGYNDFCRGIRGSVGLSDLRTLTVEFECYNWNWVTGDIEYQA